MTRKAGAKLSEELNLRMVLLQQRLAILDEILLHVSTKLDTETARYYSDVLNRYGNFFYSINHALKSSFYVELLAFLGVKLDKNKQIISDRWAQASVYNLAVIANRREAYMKLLARYRDDVVLVDEVRHKIAHATALTELNNLNVPGYDRTVMFLNEVAGFVMEIHDRVHGIPGWNKPHTLDDENVYADDTEGLIHSITSSSRADEMRIRYKDAKQRMRENKIT